MKAMTEANAKQISGDHYKTSFQHWDMLVAIGYGSEYYAGQVSKYLMRWRKKNGLRDVNKAHHFIEKMIELAKDHKDFLKLSVLPVDAHQEYVEARLPFLTRFFEANQVPPPEQIICATVLFADKVEDLEAARGECELLIRFAKEYEAANPSTDLEQPVALQFWFHGYSQDDTDRMFWRCKKCNTDLDLSLTEPPNLHHTC